MAENMRSSSMEPWTWTNASSASLSHSEMASRQLASASLRDQVQPVLPPALPPPLLLLQACHCPLFGRNVREPRGPLGPQTLGFIPPFLPETKGFIPAGMLFLKKKTLATIYCHNILCQSERSKAGSLDSLIGKLD